MVISGNKILIDSAERTNTNNLAPYHIYNGSLALASTVSTAGFSTTLYTGNGSTQSITTGVDMSTQWGNDVSETYGGLVWIKSRSASNYNLLHDTIRGFSKVISTNVTSADSTNNLIANTSTGFNILGNDVAYNQSGTTQVSWNFQTTHRRTGATNHGKAFTEHYNPFTGFTIIQYTGSGIAGHEIPHSLGRKLGFVTVKNLSAVSDWFSPLLETYSGGYVYLNATNASGTGSTHYSTDNTLVLTNTGYDLSTNQYILYGWANSYFDEANTLIGNYEIGVYQGTGAAGNKVTTKGKPAWLMVKRLDSTGSWQLQDNLRLFSNVLSVNSSNAEVVASQVTQAVDGFVLSSTSADWNLSGGQYLYMVVYDNDSGSGKSKYPKPSDSPVINLNATVPYANGIDSNGTKITAVAKNESVTGLSLTAGKNYVYSLSDGTYGRSSFAPQYGYVPTRSKAGENPDFFNLNDNKWYSTTGGSELVTNGTFDGNINGWTPLRTNGTSAGSYVSYNSSTMLIGSDGGADIAALQAISTTVGKKYKFRVNLVKGSDLAYIYLTTSGTDTNTRLYFNYNAQTGINEFTYIANESNVYLWIVCRGITGNTVIVNDVTAFEAIPTIGSAITSRNYLDAIVYGDGTGNAEYIEQLPKTQYFDEVKANDYRGRNACTAWVNVDLSTTPPTILDSYNFSGAVRTATGVAELYFATPMDNTNYSVQVTSVDGDYGYYDSSLQLNKVRVMSRYHDGNMYSYKISVAIFGGKNV